MQTAPIETEIQQYFPLVHYAIKRYRGQIDYDDLFQLGCLGLLKAIRNFKPELGFQFPTYAVAMLRGEVLNFLTRQNKAIKAPRRIVSLARQIRSNNLKSSSSEAVAKRMGCSEEDAQRSLEYLNLKIVSIHYVYEDEDGKTTLEDSIPTHDDQSEVFIHEFIQSLSDRDGRIVELRIQGKTQKEIAMKVGLTQFSVSRILNNVRDLYCREEVM